MSKPHKMPKKPKDPNAPKKNQSSYFIYSNERRPVIAAASASEDGKQSVTEISKTISAEWKTMEATQKKHYEQLAAQQKEKYNLEYEAYKKTDNYTIYSKKLEAWKTEQTALGNIGKGSKSGKFHKIRGRKPPKKPKQPDSMPKRPQSSYFIYSNKRRGQMRTTYPEKKLTELSKLIAAEWADLTAEQKKEYEDAAAVNKERYHTQITEYKKTEQYEKYQEILAQWKADTKKFKNAMDCDSENGEEMKVSLPRKPKDSKCPKRPLTSYFLYAKDIREATKQEFPNKAITEIAKEISKKWRVLSEDDKKPFAVQAAALKEQYKKDIAEYEGSESQIAFKKKLEEWKQECNRRRQAAKAKAAKKAELLAKKKRKKSKSPTKKKPSKQKKKKNNKRTRMVESSDDYSSSSDSDSGSSSDSSSGSSSSSSSGSYSSSSSSASD